MTLTAPAGGRSDARSSVAPAAASHRDQETQTVGFSAETWRLLAEKYSALKVADYSDLTDNSSVRPNCGNVQSFEDPERVDGIADSHLKATYDEPYAR